MGKYLDAKMITSLVVASLLTGVVIYAISKVPKSVPGSDALKAAVAGASSSAA